MPQRWKVARHMLDRVVGCSNLMIETNFIVKNSQMASVLGITFEDALYRGSQQQVEAKLYPLARANGFIMASPSDESVHAMRAARWVPMIMEPHSGFHSDPVLVLDFQSLYPSIMMAHNLCYSTLIPSYRVKEFKVDEIEKTPNGEYFIKKDVHYGVLPMILEELISARKAVK